MKFRPENKCSFCSKLFCCLQCRIRHQITNHFTLFAEFISCDLCSGAKGIVLQEENTKEFIDHLFMKHLPLQCRNCSVVFSNKIDLITVHSCVSSQKTENEKMNSKTGFGSEEKIEPIIEENEYDKDAESSCEKLKHANEIEAMENGKQKSKPFDGSVAENGSLIPNGSINNSENSDHTNPSSTPMTNLVRQTSTPMPKVFNEVKRRSYESMSASSIQMSSIDNCSSEHDDVSPPIPSGTSNLHTFKQPTRRMPVGDTPYRQIMSRSIQRAFNVQGLPRGRYMDSTPPLDLRTSPVIRRTKTMDGIPRPSLRTNPNMIDLRTTPVIRRSRQIEGVNIAAAINAHIDKINGTLNEYEHNKPTNQNIQNSMQESLQKSSLSKSESTNTFFETCKSFESSVSPSNQITETPKTSGISKRAAHRQIVKAPEEVERDWSTPSPESIPASSHQKLSIESSKEMNENEVKENVAKPVGYLWSFVSSVFRLGSTGGGTSNNMALSENDSNGTSLIKRCASFTGFRPKIPMNNSEDNANPLKRRRTTTLSKVESYNKLGDDENGSGKRAHRISGRPPIDRMRQS